MNILVIGSGGREHALAWRIAQSPRTGQVFVAPGNAGTAQDPRLSNVALNSIPELVVFAREQNIAFTVVGPEAPLAAGVVDAFRAAGLRIFRPTMTKHTRRRAPPSELRCDQASSPAAPSPCARQRASVALFKA